MSCVSRVFGPGSLLFAAVLASFSLPVVGCNPYEQRSESYLAGAVDPVHFPTPYLGEGGDGKRPGSGRFAYANVYVRGTKRAYYPLPFHGEQAKAQDPLDLASHAVPLAYHFDPDGTPDGRDSRRCVAPPGYVYDQEARRKDALPLNQQGNIFTALPYESDPPGNTSYIPVVREVSVRSNKNPCQAPKSEQNLVSRTDLSIDLVPPADGTIGGFPTGRPSGRYLLWILIDPAAEVLFPAGQLDPVTRLGPQRFGWFNQYITAYLDGGAIPIDPLSPFGKIRMRPQKMLFPTRMFDKETGQVVLGQLGRGFDLMEFAREDEGYSPVCQVYSFEPQDPLAGFEKSIAEVPPAGITDTGQLIYCPQIPGES